MAAFLGQVGRSEIDGDAPRRQRQARGDQCGTDPLARLRDVGHATLGAESYASLLRFNGHDAVGLAVTQLPAQTRSMWIAPRRKN